MLLQVVKLSNYHGRNYRSKVTGVAADGKTIPLLGEVLQQIVIPRSQVQMVKLSHY